jgi:signal peptidase I
MRRSRVARSAREALLTLGAVLGAACLLLGLVAVTAGVHVLVFRSGSMAPAIDTGDLALTRTVGAAELRADDVVSVIDSGGSRVTHRVVDVAGQGDQRQLTLRGDANEQPDREVYTVSDVQRVVLVVPKAGYLVAWSTGPIGLVLLGGYGAFLLSVLLRGKEGSDEDPPTRPRRRAPVKRRATRAPRRTPALLAVVLAGVLGGAMATMPTHAWAAWTDPVTVGGTTLTAHVVSPPVVSCSGLAVGSVTLNWTPVTGATNYRIHYGSSGGTTETVAPTVTSKKFSGLATSGQFSVEALRNFGAVTWESVTSNKKNYSVLLLLVSTCSDA